jgi:hypothetical protein
VEQSSRLNGGTNFPANSVVVVVWANNDGGAAPTSPTIGGNAAALVTGTGNEVFMFSFKVGGASIPDTFGWVTPNTATAIASAWIINNGASATALSSGNTLTGGADPQTLNAALSVSSGQIGLVAFMCSNPTSPTTVLWGSPSGSISPDAAANSGALYTFATSNIQTAGSWNPGATGSNSLAFKNNGIIGAVFQ